MILINNVVDTNPIIPHSNPCLLNSLQFHLKIHFLAMCHVTKRLLVKCDFEHIPVVNDIQANGKKKEGIKYGWGCFV